MQHDFAYNNTVMLIAAMQVTASICALFCSQEQMYQQVIQHGTKASGGQSSHHLLLLRHSRTGHVARILNVLRSPRRSSTRTKRVLCL